MANTFYSTQRALAQTSPKTLIDSADVSAVKCAFFDYTPPSASPPQAGDTVELCTLPIGAKVIAVFLEWAAQASGMTLAIGIAGTTSKYMAAQVMTAAGVKLAPTLLAEANLVPTTAEVVVGTVAVAAMVASTGIVKGAILYVL